MLKAQSLSKTYQNGKIDLPVLQQINLEIERGQLLCIIGPSGAGKSTLLHILAGLDQPSTGSVFFEGENLYGLNDAQRAAIRNKRLGFVFQFYHLLPELTALENVALPGLINRLSLEQANQLAQKLLQLVGLGARMQHKPGQLSGGEQQRVAIARTLINDPDIIFCDEPTGNLDSQRGAQISQLLQRLNQEQQKTLIIASHDEKIAKIAQRTIHIRDGRLV